MVKNEYEYKLTNNKLIYDNVDEGIFEAISRVL